MISLTKKTSLDIDFVFGELLPLRRISLNKNNMKNAYTKIKSVAFPLIVLLFIGNTINNCNGQVTNKQIPINSSTFITDTVIGRSIINDVEKSNQNLDQQTCITKCIVVVPKTICLDTASRGQKVKVSGVKTIPDGSALKAMNVKAENISTNKNIISLSSANNNDQAIRELITINKDKEGGSDVTK